MKGYWLTNIARFALLVTLIHGGRTQTCVRVDTCKCDMSDNTGMINLKSLGSSSGAARWSIDGGNGWTYNYNPCIGFSSFQFTGLAINQVSQWNTWEEYTLGVQSTERFYHSVSTGTSIQYDDDPFFPVRNSSVLLICDADAAEHKLEFIGELITLQYEFILTGPCACPGVCDDLGVIPPPTTTTPPVVTTTTKGGVNCDDTNQPCGPVDDSGFSWNQVGADLVSLLFHDLILVVVIGCILAITKFVLGYTCFCARADAPAKSFTNEYSQSSAA